MSGETSAWSAQPESDPAGGASCCVPARPAAGAAPAGNSRAKVRPTDALLLSPLRDLLPLPRVRPSSRARAAVRKACASGDGLVSDAAGAGTGACTGFSCCTALLGRCGAESKGDSSTAVCAMRVRNCGVRSARVLLCGNWGHGNANAQLGGTPCTAKLTRRGRSIGDRLGVFSVRSAVFAAATTVTLGALRCGTRCGV